jgi:hypothetical protein
MKRQDQQAFNRLKSKIASANIQKSFEAMLHRFMNADGQTRPGPLAI